MIVLVDFDGTCVPQLPESGYCEVDTGAERVLKRLVERGNQIVLWTARNRSRNNPFNYTLGRFRTETSLDEAIRWFKEREIPLYGVNEVPGEEDSVGYTRKAVGDLLIDDIALGIPLKYGEVDYYSYNKEVMLKAQVHCVDWETVEKMLEGSRLI